MDLANKSSTYFRTNSDNERARPQIISAVNSESTTVIQPYKRVVGNRDINLFVNIERLLQRRTQLQKISDLYQKSSGSIIPENVPFHEYAHNHVWLRETLISIAINRIIACPLLTSLNASLTDIEKAIKAVKELNSNLKTIIDIKNPYTNQILSLISGLSSIQYQLMYNILNILKEWTKIL